MAKGRFDYPTPAMDPADRDHSRCPVCGWSPCTLTCSLGLTAGEVIELALMFPCEHGERFEDQDDG